MCPPHVQQRSTAPGASPCVTGSSQVSRVSMAFFGLWKKPAHLGKRSSIRLYVLNALGGVQLGVGPAGATAQMSAGVRAGFKSRGELPCSLRLVRDLHGLPDVSDEAAYQVLP